jgi:hypothetical protein
MQSDSFTYITGPHCRKAVLIGIGYEQVWGQERLNSFSGYLEDVASSADAAAAGGCSVRSVAMLLGQWCRAVELRGSLNVPCFVGD